MHEHIKYTVNLSSKVEPLKESDNIYKKEPTDSELLRLTDWQAIFGDVKYGTEFFIYSKIIGEKKGKSSFEVKLIQLYLQNYQGSVTLGFSGHPKIKAVTLDSTDPEFDSRYKGRTKYYLYPIIQGLHSNNLVKDMIPESLILNDGDILETIPAFRPVDECVSLIGKENIYNTKFADSLFLERNGNDITLTDEGATRLKFLDYVNGLDQDKIEEMRVFDSLGRWVPCRPRNTIFKLID